MNNILQTLIGHLDFTEAIQMAELTEQANQIVEQDSPLELGAHYNSLHSAGAWRAVHVVRSADGKTWALILQRGTAARFAVVCGHAGIDEIVDPVSEALMSNAAPMVSSSSGHHTIPVINTPTESNALLFQLGLDQFSIEKLWGALQKWTDSYAAPYQAMHSEPVPPPQNAKVFQPWLTACEAVQDEIDLFFKSLSGLKFVQRHFEHTLYNPGRQAAQQAAIGAALRIRFGADTGLEMLGALEQGASTDAVTPAPMTIPAELLAKEESATAIWRVPETGFTITFTGHGTGGAIASLLALYAKRSWESDLDFPLFQCEMYTFGSPKVGNRAFVDYFNQLLPDRSHQVLNLLDVLIYGPYDETPLPTMLRKMLPKPVSLHTFNPDVLNWGNQLGINSILGQLNEQWVGYQHIDTRFFHLGFGKAPVKFNLPLSISPLAVPFEHDPAGYKALLFDAQAQYNAISGPVQGATEYLEKGREQVSSMVQAGAEQAQTLFN